MAKNSDINVKVKADSSHFDRGLKQASRNAKSFSHEVSKGLSKIADKLGWAALGAAVVSFAKNLITTMRDTTQMVGDSWARFTGGLKASWQEFARSVATGNFTDLFGRLAETNRAGRETVNIMDEIFELTNAAGIQGAKLRPQMEEAATLMRDQTLSLQERIKYGETYLRLAKQISDLQRPAAEQKKIGTERALITAMFGRNPSEMTAAELADARKMIQGTINDYITNREFFAGAVADYQRQIEQYRKAIAAESANMANYASSGNIKMVESKKAIIDQLTTEMRAYEAQNANLKYWAEALNAYNRTDDATIKAYTDALIEWETLTAALEQSSRRAKTTLSGLYNQMAKLNEIDYKPIKSLAVKFDDLSANSVLKMTEDYNKEINAEIEATFASMMEADPMDEWLLKKRMQADQLRDITNMFSESISSGIVSSLDYLAEALGSGEFDATSLVKTLLNPIANACISAGMMVLATGTGVEAFKTSLESLQGASAIAAGAALIAVGVAAKAGLSALGRGATATGRTSTASSGTGAASGVSQEITINVVGHISGQDIALSLDRTRKNWAR